MSAHALASDQLSFSAVSHHGDQCILTKRLASSAVR
jgi:hypothetical protein